MNVEIERRGAIRRVRFEAGKRNALDLEAIRALATALAPDPEAPVVVLSGRPDGFSVGLDNAVLAGAPRDRETLLHEMGVLLLDLLRGPTRVVSICEGHAVAGGAMLLLVSDVRIGVAGDYQIGFTEPRIGMTLPALPALLARERLDRRRLHEATVLGRTFGPDEGAGVGFLDAVETSADAAETTAMAAAEELARLGDDAYRGTIRTVWGAAIEGMERSVEAQCARREST